MSDSDSKPLAASPAETPTVAEVLEVLDELYPPGWAEAWDAVGLVCGDPTAPCRRVLFAVDPVSVVAREAVAVGADLLVTHHPLLLRPVHGVPADTPKGRLVHELIRAGVALHVVHTNADVAEPGVSDALAVAVGLRDLRPLVPGVPDEQDKLVTFVPHENAVQVLDALADAGAGVIGDYTRCAWTTSGTGTFRPGEGAAPAIGDVGRVEQVPETRLEMVVPRVLRSRVVAALRAAHPYEEPAYDLYEVAAPPTARGLGRVGELPAPVPLAEFARGVARALPATPVGVRFSGEPDVPVGTVAVCGGAGDGVLDAARTAGVDAYLTADLRHHPASEAAEHGGPALLDAGHWATEWPWLAHAAQQLTTVLGERGKVLETLVSDTVTDPWTSVSLHPAQRL